MGIYRKTFLFKLEDVASGAINYVSEERAAELGKIPLMAVKVNMEDYGFDEKAAIKDASRTALIAWRKCGMAADTVYVSDDVIYESVAKYVGEL